MQSQRKEELKQKILFSTEASLISKYTNQNIDTDEETRNCTNVFYFDSVIQKINAAEIALINGETKFFTCLDWINFKEYINILKNKYNEALTPLSEAQEKENYFRILHHYKFLTLCRKVIHKAEQKYGANIKLSEIIPIGKNLQICVKYNYIIDKLAEIKSKKDVTMQEQKWYEKLQKSKEEVDKEVWQAYAYLFGKKKYSEWLSYLEKMLNNIKKLEEIMVFEKIIFATFNEWNIWKENIYVLKEKYNETLNMLENNQIKIKIGTQEQEFLYSLIENIAVIENRYHGGIPDEEIAEIMKYLQIICKYNYYVKKGYIKNEKRDENNSTIIINIQKIKDEKEIDYKQVLQEAKELISNYEKAIDFLFGKEKEEKKAI